MHEITVFAILYGILPAIFYKVLKVKLIAIEPFIWVVFIASLYEFIGTLILKLNSEYWFIFYKILAFISINYFFYKLLNGNYLKIFVSSVIIFIVLSTYVFFDWNDLNFLDVNAYFNSLQTIIVLVLSILWFVRIFNNLELDSFTKSPNFYFVSGLILYYSGTIFLFLYSSFIYKVDKSNFHAFWMLNIFFNLVLRTLLIVGVWKGRVK